MALNYSFELPFEKDFDPNGSTEWMQQNWTLSIGLSIFYVVCIYIGQQLMESKSQFQLKRSLVLWNAFLAVFSILGCLRMSPEFFYVLRHYGFEYSMCDPSFAAGVPGFWTEMFAYSKVLEFGDTFFIVARKRPVIFLHWYHHITVLTYTWHAYKEHTAAGRWFIWMNYTVHAFMYSYYALSSLGKRFPKWVPMSVTTLQIAQMVIGCIIAINAYRIKSMGGYCHQTYNNLYFSFSIYFTYFLLFANFFYHVYMRRGGKHNRTAVQTQSHNKNE